MLLSMLRSMHSCDVISRRSGVVGGLAAILVAECEVCKDSQVSLGNYVILTGIKLHICNKQFYHAKKHMLHIKHAASQS